MTDRRNTRAARTRVLAAICATALVASGCTTLPRSTTPQAIRTFEAPAQELDIPEPRPDVAPDLVLRDFYTASAHPTDNYAAAREFLTDDAAATWNPAESTLIVDGINVIADGPVSQGGQTFGTRGAIVGQLGPNGAYETHTTAYEDTVRMVRGTDGQWRIAELPDGVVLERQNFLDNNSPRNIYFLDPTGNHLVPDRRWIYRGVADASIELLGKMQDGPRQRLAAGVSTALPPEAGIEVIPHEGTPGKTVRLTGLGNLDQDLRALLAAQIVWTLSSADVRGPWILEADGAPLVETHEGPWTRDSDELRYFDPAHGPADTVPLHTVDAGGLYRITQGTAEVVGEGWTTSGSELFVSAAVGVDVTGRELIAAVSRADRGGETGSRLLLGDADTGPREVFSADILTRPSWSPDGASVWTVADGDQIIRLVASSESGQPRAEEVDMTGLVGIGGAISELRVDASGTQVAFIADGRIFTATIEQTTTGPWRLVNPRALNLPEGTAPVTLAWAPNSTIIVGAYGEESPMWRLYPDGSLNYMLPKLNLSPPIAVVAATSSKIYALDDNALMELVTGEGEEQFWRAVTGVGGRAAPVTAE
ncbi:LpqB family beta-propeller domain-containing protein [uncultured Corynebacterium sp.]|uniref:LpqB family beta-propeller domain-containing protein n=1 Tax=uncultured Corynebacterium sp. TaxID=159447 RepID=UPI002639B119|nr:LpqB family beta-propeller domain-containing protein [uncultured Corynebacterium sp.]